MAVASTMKKVVILILFCSANGYRQTPHHNLKERRVSPSSDTVPQESFVEHIPPRFYNLPYRSALQVASSQTDSTELRDMSSKSIPSLFTSLSGAFKNTAYFWLSVLDLTDADRHDMLRLAADNYNGIIDSIWNTYTNFENFKQKVIKTLADLPIVGIFVQVFEKVSEMVNYLPMKIFTIIKGLIRQLFTTKQLQSDGLAVVNT